MPRRRPFEIGRCACGASVRIDSFRDRASYLGFERRRLCQECIDAALVARAGHCALRRGAVVVGVSRPGVPVEFAAIPFVYAEHRRFLAWDARTVCRIGAGPEASDPWGDLRPMEGSLRDHQVCVHDGTDVHDPVLAECLGPVGLLLGLKSHGLQSFASDARLPGSPPCLVEAADAFAWCGTFGQPLTPLASFSLHLGLEPVLLDPWAPTPSLRTCARLGAALSLPVPGPDPSGLTVMDCALLSARGGR